MTSKKYYAYYANDLMATLIRLKIVIITKENIREYRKRFREYVDKHREQDKANG